MQPSRPTPPRPAPLFQAFTPAAMVPVAIGETTLRETNEPFAAAFAAPAPAAPAPPALPGSSVAPPGSVPVPSVASVEPAPRRPVSLAFVAEAERSGVSKQELLALAAALGPARMTWESIVLPDPVLDEKRQPYVAERRERFTRMVKIGLGACLAVCVLALGITAISGQPSASAAEPTTAAGTLPTKGITTLETLAGARHGKAARPAPTTPTKAARAKRR